MSRAFEADQPDRESIAQPVFGEMNPLNTPLPMRLAGQGIDQIIRQRGDLRCDF
jgi:hypothetical protein